MDEGTTDLSNPIWHNPDFPSFYRNAEALLPLESSIRLEARKLKSLGSGRALKQFDSLGSGRALKQFDWLN